MMFSRNFAFLKEKSGAWYHPLEAFFARFGGRNQLCNGNSSKKCFDIKWITPDEGGNQDLLIIVCVYIYVYVYVCVCVCVSVLINKAKTLEKNR